MRERERKRERERQAIDESSKQKGCYGRGLSKVTVQHWRRALLVVGFVVALQPRERTLERECERRGRISKGGVLERGRQRRLFVA